MSEIATRQETSQRRQPGPAFMRKVAIAIAAFVVLAWVAAASVPMPVAEKTLLLANGYLVPPALAVAGCAFVVTLLRLRSDRAFWYLLLAGTLLLLLGETYAAWYRTTLSSGSPAAPSVADALLFAGYAALIAALLSLSSLRALGQRDRLTGVLDVGAVTIAAFALLYGLVVSPALAAGSADTRMAQSVQLLVVMVDVAFIAAAAFAVLGFKRAAWLPWELLFVGGLACFLVGDVSRLLVTSRATSLAASAVGDWVGSAWVTGYLCFFLAAAFRLPVLGALEVGGPTAITRHPASRWRENVLPAVLVVTIPALLIAAYLAPGPFELAVIAFSGLLLTGLVVLRLLVGRQERDRLREGAVIDPLTGLPNVRAFGDELRDAIAEAAVNGSRVTLAFFDVDGLEVINEVDGHEAGDEALRTVAEIVEDALPAFATAARLDAGRFGLVFERGGSFDAFVSCRALVERVDEDGRLDPVVSVVCGIAGYPDEAQDADALMRNADTAARWAQRHGGRVTVYEPDLGDEVQAVPDQTESRDPVRSLQVLAAAIDASDADTRSHSANVAVLSVSLARRIGLDDDNVERVRLAGSLHDLGKIGVPETLLHKGGDLTEDERGTMRSHPELAAQMLQATEASELAPWIRSHHERWDGEGYPDELSGEGIPLAARIIALADSYDAMTSPRAWRDAMSEPEALRRIAEGAGTQFDPDLVGPFASVVESGERLATSDPAHNGRRYLHPTGAGAR